MGSSYPYRSAGRRSRLAADRGAASWLFTAGLVLFAILAGLTLRSAHRAWQATVADSRSEALFDLVRVATPTRPTDTPGAVAWLDLQVKRYGQKLADVEPAEYQDLVSVSRSGVPTPLAALPGALSATTTVPTAAGDLYFLSAAQAAAAGFVDPESGDATQGFRVQRFIGYRTASGERTFVLTRRNSLDAPFGAAGANPSNRFLRRVVPYLDAVARRLAEAPPPSRLVGRTLDVLRIYAIAEDGTFVSLPSPGAAIDGTVDEALRAAIRHEGQEFRKQPKLPSYASNEFFFQFDFSPPSPSARYSGLYLDLASHGLVATVTVPVAELEPGSRAVAAIDIAFEIEWEDFARDVEPPRVARVVDLDPSALPTWQPWKQLLRALDPPHGSDDRALRRAVAALVEKHRDNLADAGSLYHDTVDGEGAVACFQVSRSQWLVVLFPELPARFPVAAALLLVLGLSLLALVEGNRRRAETAQSKAEAELQEKENLLNSMRVPLTVVDPNSDAVVFGNATAIALGLEPGCRVTDLVPSERARAHYDRMQRLSNETRRAYGVPLALRAGGGGTEIRHAVVRSVAVAAPIDTLHADERHRLGLFFPLEPEADLAIFAEELESRTRDDERRRLAGLLAHGVDTLARVLAHRLARGAPEAFDRWMVAYLERRLSVTAWLLENWNAAPPLPPAATVESPQVQATLERFQHIFAHVRADAELRSRLHWDNGVLAPGAAEGRTAEGPPAGDPSTEAVFELRFHWPDEYLFTCPVRGGIGLFLEEVLVNAVRHGRPGSRPRVEVDLDPVRRELRFAVANDTAATAARDLDDLEPYGGRRILERLAALFDWPGLAFERSAERFNVTWRIPVGERAAPDEVD